MPSGDVTPGAVLSMEQPWDLPTLDQVLEWGTLQGASKSKGGGCLVNHQLRSHPTFINCSSLKQSGAIKDK